TCDSEEFRTLVGAPTAALLGRPWGEISAALGLDPEGHVARAVATRDTWSGISIAWPIEGAEERLAVVLSGLPMFDRKRAFRGYRGFGICRDGTRQPTPVAAPPHPAAATTPREAVIRGNAEQPAKTIEPLITKRTDPSDVPILTAVEDQ